MSKFWCFFGRHNTITVAACDADQYYSEDKFGHKRYSYLRLYQCSCCGERSVKTDNMDHRFIRKDAMDWVETGKIRNHMIKHLDEARLKIMETFG